MVRDRSEMLREEDLILALEEWNRGINPVSAVQRHTSV
jgi:hypothetical protein